ILKGDVVATLSLSRTSIEPSDSFVIIKNDVIDGAAVSEFALMVELDHLLRCIGRHLLFVVCEGPTVTEDAHARELRLVEPQEFSSSNPLEAHGLRLRVLSLHAVIANNPA